ncbi:MAG: ral secretion pathway protein [Acidobacteriota bacterium]|jgi:general secretion pathway protein G|nr:ral secretion pathway protein [Acidobacteriota bacterium]
MFGSERRQVNSLSRRRARGFTLLELMIVISILVILALIAMSQYNKTVLAARESTLREDLFTMRKMIDQYAADKGKLPQSLDDLKGAGYIHDIPIDPITDAADWQVEFGEDPGSTGGEQGVTNVHSASGDVASDGSSRYSEW